MIAYCPRCDYQGIIEKARIIATGEIIHLCDECDATWLDGMEFRIDNFKDFSTLLESKGLQGVGSEIEFIKEDKPEP